MHFLSSQMFQETRGRKSYERHWFSDLQILRLIWDENPQTCYVFKLREGSCFLISSCIAVKEIQEELSLPFYGNVPCGANIWASLVLIAVHILTWTFTYKMITLQCKVRANLPIQIARRKQKAVAERVGLTSSGHSILSVSLISQLLSLFIDVSVRFSS